jgi:hypothetical protein
MSARSILTAGGFSLRALCASLCAAAAVLSVAADSDAQYFGRNKVKYETFDFKELRTAHFDLYYYPAEESAARNAGVMLEKWYERFSRIFGMDLSDRQPVILYANHADFQQTNVIQGIVGQGTGGVTEGMKRRIALPLTGIVSEDDHVLGHELVHAFQFDIVGRSGVGGGGSGIPLWAIEGMAEYLTLGRNDSETAMYLRDAVLHDDVPSIRDISTNPKYFPYRYGHALWSYIAAEWGDRTVPRLFAAAVDSGWSSALRGLLGTDEDSLSAMWRREVKKTYRPLLEGMIAPADVGEAVATGDQRMNIAPVVSPDGRRMAYLSRRDIFTLDLYLAETETGNIIKKLVSSNTDAHFDALRFMRSAGAWSPDGTELAFVTFEDGDNRIAVLDVESLEQVREFAPKGVGDIRSLAWSPDGGTIAFDGTRGGISDVYLYDLGSEETNRLTRDEFAEMHPAWSPDGGTLAFATDGRDDGALPGDRVVGIALMDVKEGRIRYVSIPGARKHTNPRFSPGGESVYFIADPDGVDNIYAYSLSDGSVSKLTNAATGIAGLTGLSPAMSVARQTGDIVFSVFDRQGYVIRRLRREASAGAGLAAPHGDRANEALPPVESATRGLVEGYLGGSSVRGGDGGDFETGEYETSLGLLAIAPASIGVSTDHSGASVTGGTSLLFGDMLGNHRLGVTFTASGSIKDFGGEVRYQDLRGRTNWGLAAAHLPNRSVYGVSRRDTVEVDGESTEVLIRDLVRERTFVDAVTASAEYPVSTNRRLEMFAGFTRLSFDREVDRTVAAGGSVIDESGMSVPSPKGLNLGNLALAYVGDYSFFGIGSPARGKRYRLEAEQTVGSLTYMTALADYRHYFFFNPLTFAVRVTHRGRYFADAEDDRLLPLFLGYENLVRGYSADSFTPSECGGESDPERCPEIDRLIGSRIGVVNMELRIPLIGGGGYGLVDFRYLPTEIAPFLDAGVAWARDEDPVFELARTSAERIPVFSTGVAVRFLVLGGLVTQLYYAYPFQRPEKGGHFRFLILNGW